MVSDDSVLWLGQTPELHEPVLLVMMGGWIDAGNAATATIDAIAMDDEDLATFDTGTVQFTGLFFDGSAQSLALNTDLDAAEATPNEVPVEMSIFTAD